MKTSLSPFQPTKIIGTAALAGALAAYGGFVSFQNAKLFEGDATQMTSGVLARPRGEGPFPAVVLLHTCGGLSTLEMEDWPNYLTNLGYVTLSVDSFGPRKITRCPTPFSNPTELSRDAYGALDYLASLPFVDKQRVGVMGFSTGGNTIDYLAGRGFKSGKGLDFKAQVSLYGRCDYLVAYAKSIPTIVIIGERENVVRLSPCKTLAEKPPPSVKVYLLPDTYHSFDNRRYTSVTNDFNGNPQLYSWKATERARAITKAFLAEHLGK